MRDDRVPGAGVGKARHERPRTAGEADELQARDREGRRPESRPESRVVLAARPEREPNAVAEEHAERGVCDEQHVRPATRVQPPTPRGSERPPGGEEPEQAGVLCVGTSGQHPSGGGGHGDRHRGEQIVGPVAHPHGVDLRVLSRDLEDVVVEPTVVEAVEDPHRSRQDRDDGGGEGGAPLEPVGDQGVDRHRSHRDEHRLLGGEGEHEASAGGGAPRSSFPMAEQVRRAQPEQESERVDARKIEEGPRLAVGRGEEPHGEQWRDPPACLAAHELPDRRQAAQRGEHRDQAQRHQARAEPLGRGCAVVEVAWRVDEWHELEARAT